MAEKEVKIKVSTETDTRDVEDLEDKLQELKDTKLQMQLEADTQELDDVNSQIEETQSKLDELRADPTVDDSEIQALEDELAELEGRQIDLEIAVNTAELDQAKASMDELESSSQGATSSIDGVGSALTAVAATAGLEKMVETADNINNSWNRLELTFAGTGVSIDQLKQKQSELQASTGQTGGTIRNFFNDMGIAGVTNTNLLGSAFESLSGKAYQTGSSVEEMEGKFQRMVMSGNASSRMLVSMGITAQDLANAMGVSADEVSEAFKNMTPEERIQALTKAMGDGKQANEMYKNSFQGLKTQAEAALAGLVGAVGQAILPVIIPMLKLATQGITTLTNAFKGLPAPVRTAIGAFGGIVLGATAIVGVLGVAGKVIKGLYEGFQTLQKAVKFIRELELATKAYAAMETIANGVRKAAAAAQAALNFVMSMNPIALVVIAIVALVAILWYLYNTCEPVRNAIDAIWEGITSAIQPIIDSVQWLIDKLTALANGDWTVTIEIVKAGVDTAVDTTMDLANNDVSRGIVSMLLGPDALAQIDEAMPAFQEKLTTSINDMLTSIWDNGTWGFLDWLTNLSGIDVGSYLSGMQSSFASIPEWVNQAGIGAIQGFQGMFAGISSWLNSIITNVVSFGGRLVNSITTAARNAWTSFVNNIKGMWKHMAEEVDAILREARRLLEQLPSMLWNAAVNMVRGWLTGSGEGSPGFMFYAFDEDLGAMESRAKDNNIASLIGGTARDMVKSWGSPNLTYSIEGTADLSAGNGLELGEILRLLGEVVAAIRGSDGKGNISNTFVLNGDMDSEDRMRKFLDAVIREMEWDNNKAGRTIDNGGYI